MTRAWIRIPDRQDPRLAVAAILAAYVLLGITVMGFNRNFEQVLAIVAAAVALDFALHRLFRRDAPALFPFSALITGLSLSILVNYAHGLSLALVPVVLAIGSKYLFTFNGKHVYNPALFGVAASLLLADGMISESPAYQWGGTWAAVAFVLTFGLLMFVVKIRRGTLIVSFLLFYFAALAVRAWLTRWHMPFETWFMGALSSPAFYLFTFFMITDPQTSPDSRRGQVLLAAGIVLVDFVLHFKLALSTHFFAAFACATARLLFLHGRAILDGWEKTAARLRGAAPRWALAGTLALVGAAAHRGIAAGEGDGEIPFRFVELDTQASGITARPGKVLEEVDPRIRHIAKWLLSVGDAVAVADVDGDGLPDLFLTHSLKDPRDRAALYRNLGDFRFERIPIAALGRFADARTGGLPSGAIFLDYDNDGDQDLLVLAGWGHPMLLRNRLVEDGRLGFEDVTRELGLDAYTVSIAANALDIDRDGRLDIVIGNAMSPQLLAYAPPRAFNIFKLPDPETPADRRMFDFMHRTWHDASNGGGTMFFMNRGAAFENVDARRLGIKDRRWTIAIGAGDLDGDGWPDLYLANDFGPDQLLLNRGGQRFENVRGRVPGSIGRDTYKGMNSTIADFDGDGRLDIYVSNVHERLQAEGSLLWMNHAGKDAAQWRDEAVGRNVLNERRFGWGAAAGDLDRDGRLDIVQANGMVDNAYDPIYRDCPDYWYWNDKIALTHPDVHGMADRWADLRGRCIFPLEMNRVYLNRGNDFVDVAAKAGWSRTGNSRGIALVDLDNDGTLDAVVTRQFAPVSIYRNESAPRTWIGLALEGNATTCNRDAVGTRVVLRAPRIPHPQVREVSTANGFAAQGDRRLHFGLGDSPGPAELEIFWCGTASAQHLTLAPGRYHAVRQP